MKTINQTKTRIGNFTSSGIAALMSNGKGNELFGKPALTYIAERNMERRLGRSLNVESNAKPLSWGNFLESRAFDLLGFEYSLISQETIQHPTINCWSGSPDGTKENTVIDIKCPLTLKSFCQFVDCKDIEEVRNNHPSGETYYWQLVSNAILTNSDFAELIVYLPYKSELEEIREATALADGNQNKLAWINFAEDEDLPYLPDGGYYKNINVIRFKVPAEDKAALISRVEDASKLLVERL